MQEQHLIEKRLRVWKLASSWSSAAYSGKLLLSFFSLSSSIILIMESRYRFPKKKGQGGSQPKPVKIATEKSKTNRKKSFDAEYKSRRHVVIKGPRASEPCLVVR